MIDTYGPRFAASAVGANALLRYVLAAAFPLFTVSMYEALGIGWATSVLELLRGRDGGTTMGILEIG